MTARPRQQQDVLNDIKLALVTAQLSADNAGGFNPYDSRMGSVPRDVWRRPHGRR